MNIAKRNQRMTRMTAACFVVLVIILLALTSYADLGAIPAPTPTPQNENHCMMLTDGICYIVFPANCTVGDIMVYGNESAGVPVTCDPVKGE